MPTSLANEIDTKLEKAFENGELGGLHSVHVMKDEKILPESYFSEFGTHTVVSNVR